MNLGEAHLGAECTGTIEACVVFRRVPNDHVGGDVEVGNALAGVGNRVAVASGAIVAAHAGEYHIVATLQWNMQVWADVGCLGDGVHEPLRHMVHFDRRDTYALHAIDSRNTLEQRWQ